MQRDWSRNASLSNTLTHALLLLLPGMMWGRQILKLNSDLTFIRSEEHGQLRTGTPIPKAGHKIQNPKSGPNPNRNTRSVPDLKYKKYLNGSYRVLQNISEPKVLLTEPERVTRKPENPKKYLKKPIRISKLIYNINIWNINMYFKYSISYLFGYDI